MAMPRGEEFWRRVVVEAEGKSATAVAAKHGVSVCSVLRWRQKLRTGVDGSTALVPVRVVGTSARRVEVQIGGVLVGFAEGTDPSYVAALARALGA
jgi:transposase-like protein